MSRSARHTFLALGTLCFLAMVSGLALHFHLAHLEKPTEHDSSNCSLCRQLLVPKKDYTTHLEPANIEINPVGRIVPVRPTTLSHQSSPTRFHARAPPA